MRACLRPTTDHETEYSRRRALNRRATEDGETSRHGHLALDATVRGRVLGASAATRDRLLRPTRAAVAGQRVRRRSVPAGQRSVPVRTFAEWEDTLPGDLEADLPELLMPRCAHFFFQS